MKTGQKLGADGITVSRNEAFTDGPFGESMERIGGYWFILAPGLKEAAQIAAKSEDCRALGGVSGSAILDGIAYSGLLGPNPEAGLNTPRRRSALRLHWCTGKAARGTRGPRNWRSRYSAAAASDSSREATPYSLSLFLNVRMLMSRSLAAWVRLPLVCSKAWKMACFSSSARGRTG